MSEHKYTKEILGLILNDGVSPVLQEYIITLVRSGYFDRDNINKTLGFGIGAVSNIIYEAATSNKVLSSSTLKPDNEQIKKLQHIDYFGIGLDKKIHLIKEVRSITRWGLKESKEFVDYIHPELLKLETKMK